MAGKAQTAIDKRQAEMKASFKQAIRESKRCLRQSAHYASQNAAEPKQRLARVKRIMRRQKERSPFRELQI